MKVTANVPFTCTELNVFTGGFVVMTTNTFLSWFDQNVNTLNRSTITKFILL